MFLLALGGDLAAQAPSNNCGYNAGNQYTVNTSCVYQDFDKSGFNTVSYVPPGNTCGSGNFNDAWGWFTAFATTTELTYDPDFGHRAIMHVFTGACGALVQVGCVDAGAAGANANLTLTTVPGTNYIVRIQRSGSNSAMDGRLCIWSIPPPPPANDEPCAAITLPVNTTCTSTATTNQWATQTAGLPPPGCGNLAAGSVDVWYQFTAPPSGITVLQTTAGSLTNASMAVYTAASCMDPFTLVACNADDGPGQMPFINLTGLTPGQDYYVRVWGSGTAMGTFNICAFAPAVPAGDCVYSLELFDTGKNGWGSSAVQVRLNGGAWTNYTVSGAQAYYNIVLLAFTLGDLFEVRYVNTGLNQNQNRYLLRTVPAGQGVFVSGPTPTPVSPTIAFSETITCTPPPPRPEDCAGGVGICNAQTFSGSPAGSGFSQDLDPSNYGCLLNGERQGVWYHFSPTAPGTIGFSINPTNATDDYDFAVWGPNSGVVCPPAGPPLRCSYAAGGGPTGCGNGAVDLSEGGGGDRWVAPFMANAGEYFTLYISNWSQSGLAFNLSWQLGAGTSLDCAVLPMELLDLAAEPVPAGIDVKWATATEQHASHFMVERALDGVDFRPIGRVEAAGYSQQLNHYTFTDADPFDGLNYYRLIQVDLDGTAVPSPVVSAQYRRQGVPFTLHPNPAADRLQLTLDTPLDDAAHVRLMDARGRQVALQSLAMSAGDRSLHIATADLDAGTYLVVVEFNAQRPPATGRFIKH
ncbi:MAG: T9SS type A sorting domain-containing protein [Flavobacteriales bacterium]|nr:T9SS type A sorting domain-containing protein [Flavobacteriales bacterium]